MPSARDALLAWGATLARVYMAASAVALVLVVRAVPDFPLDLRGFAGTLALLATPAVAAFGACWRAPAKWLYFIVPVALPALAVALAKLAIDAPHALADLPQVPTGEAFTRLVPLALVAFPAALVGAAVAGAGDAGAKPRAGGGAPRRRGAP